ncbi:MAG: aminotransferase class I/II-fold pyridoxal phosphate-dependent enzyme [Thiomicrospira sp.]|uniref:pyridoxal phosphate-dependent aminotransferase n=1 Tax=Thiomicrospira sp. TaxID=935 RepID=UPI0019F502CD|nr:aminotransferase class I/II-fold pyridoxal phosphate-dependent enzyme [Thiomicrospira sp.]MBE0493952.1 aminotransferase class I/II-fold pyridoxal phosphate-dependent enzyme [Thiomicrospira sp.]
MSQHGGQFFEFAQRQGLSPQQALARVLDFSASINPNQPHYDLNLQPALWTHYPPQQAHDLLVAIADKFQLATDHIRLTNGISSAILSLFAHLRPHTTLLFTPLYGEYQRAAAFYSQTTIELKRDVNQPDHQAWCLPDLPANSLVVFVNPSTPDGHYYAPHNLEKLIHYWRQQDCWVVVDESFLPFLGFDDHLSFRRYLKDWPKLIIMQSLTKYYACPGLRVGAVFAQPDLLKTWPQAAWPISYLDSQLLQQALEDPDFDNRNQAWLLSAKADLIQHLQSCALVKKVMPGSANFVLVQTQRPAQQIAQALENQQILVRACDSFSAGLDKNHLRISVQTPTQHQRLIHALNQLNQETPHAII